MSDRRTELVVFSSINRAAIRFTCVRTFPLVRESAPLRAADRGSPRREFDQSNPHRRNPARPTRRRAAGPRAWPPLPDGRSALLRAAGTQPTGRQAAAEVVGRPRPVRCRAWILNCGFGSPELGCSPAARLPRPPARPAAVFCTPIMLGRFRKDTTSACNEQSDRRNRHSAPTPLLCIDERSHD